MDKYLCPECGYVYDESLGDRHEGFDAGTQWEQLPDDFCCPHCAVRYKEDFTRLAPGDGPDAAAAGM